MRNVNGAPLRMVSTVRDVTTMREAEALVRLQGEALAAAANAIVITDSSGVIRWVNPAFTRLTGYSEAEAIGARTNILKSGEHPATFYRGMWETVTSGKVWRGTLTNRRKDGSTYVEDMTVTPVRDDGHEITHFIAIKQDVTDQRRAEQAMQQAKEAAEAASRAKSDFVANVSHELRTPMNAIIGMSDLLLDTEITTEQREYIEVVSHSAEALLTLIDEILDISRIEAGTITFTSEVFRPREVLEKALAPLIGQARAKGLELTCAMAPEVPERVVGDPGRLRQVVINLVANAIKFTDHGGIAVSVDCETGDDARHFCHFSVVDTGIGIPRDKHDSIFEAFSQIDSSLTRSQGGAGLGLAIVRDLVERMGGGIWVESEPGRGSTFHFTAPFDPDPSDPSEPASETVEPARRRMSRRGLRILVAEDEPVNRRLVQRILERQGHQVTLACNGGEAVDLHRRQPFDLILMDVQMPGMSGLEATAAIRDQEQASHVHTPIVALTAHAMKGDRERCLQAGMNSYLSKPLRRHKLLELIERLGPADDADPREEGAGRIDSSSAGPSWDEVLDRSGGDAELLREIVGLFCKQGPELLGAVRQAIGRADAVGLTRAAHKLKGAVGNFGANAATASAQRLELLGEAGDLESAQRDLRGLESEIGGLQRALERLVAENLG